jgi:hypothetical protein
MVKPITKFFAEHGFPYRNPQWSWGGRNGNSILLRTWMHLHSFKKKTVVVLGKDDVNEFSDSNGLNERLAQLRDLWLGDFAGYTVIAEAKDPAVYPRVIKAYREDAVFAIKQLEAQADGSIVASLGVLVPVDQLLQHAKTYRTQPANGAFPVGIV